MTVNGSVTYPAGSTLVEVVQILRDYFVSTLGWTVITDSTPGTASCIVAAQHAGLPVQSQAYIDIYGLTTNIHFQVQDSAGNLISETNSAVTTKNGHALDLTNGGRFYIDGDDVGGEWLVIRSTKHLKIPVINAPMILLDLCTVESSDYPNFGIITSASASNNQGTNLAGAMLYWVTPTGHRGIADNNLVKRDSNANAYSLRSEVSVKHSNGTTSMNYAATGIYLSHGTPGGIQPYRLWVIDDANTDGAGNDDRHKACRGPLKNIRALDPGGHSFRAPMHDYINDSTVMVYASIFAVEFYKRQTFAVPYAP
jgi:hypothetical protein